MLNLQKLLLRKTRPVLNISIDIGSSNLKIAAISKKEGVARLENFIIEPISGKENLPEEIKKFFVTSSITDKSVNAALSGNNVTLRYAYMPRMSEEELKSSLHFEASKYMPINLENSFLDYQILKLDCPDNKMLVLIVAVEKPILQERIKLLKDCGLSVKVIDVDSIAAINAFNDLYYAAHRQKKKNNENETISILDLGAGTSSISILQNSSPYFTRAVSFAGSELDKRIANSLNITGDEAKKVKENLANSKNDEALNVLNAAYNDLLSEVQVSFDYFESHFNTSIERMFLLGGTAKSFGLKDALSKALGMEVISPDISEGILAEESLRDKLRENSGSLAGALGLGLRDD